MKAKVYALGPLNYISVDNKKLFTMKHGEEKEIEFSESIQVCGSPFNPARCNVQIVLEGVLD